MCTQSKANFWGPIQLLSFTVQALVPLLILKQFWNYVRILHMICFLRLKHWKMSPLSLGEWVRHPNVTNPIGIGQILFRRRTGALVFVQLSMGLQQQNRGSSYRHPSPNASSRYATSSPTFHLLLFIFSLIFAIHKCSQECGSAVERCKGRCAIATGFILWPTALRDCKLGNTHPPPTTTCRTCWRVCHLTILLLLLIFIESWLTDMCSGMRADRRQKRR